MKKFGLALALVCLIGAPAAAQIPDEFTNLKLFPEDIGKRELIGAMRSFAGALGVRCNHCHVGPENLEGMDFATDELEHKRVARAMMQMTDQINGKLLPATGREVTLEVRCVTCHRGITKPEQIDDILTAAVEKGGADAALARYSELREEHYGSGSYNFSGVTLASLAETVARQHQDMDGAIKVLKQSVEYDPDFVLTYMMLGQVLLQTGDKEAAQAAIEKALKLEPDNEWAKGILARIKQAE